MWVEGYTGKRSDVTRISVYVSVAQGRRDEGGGTGVGSVRSWGSVNSLLVTYPVPSHYTGPTMYLPWERDNTCNVPTSILGPGTKRVEGRSSSLPSLRSECDRC